MSVLATAASSDGVEVLCLMLLVATIIAFVVGVVEALGISNFTNAGGRYGALVLSVILLVVYLIVC